MKIAGIIAEYDPFHSGHAYHIKATRAMGATHIAVVISGSFTQRGEPAMLPKWQRAEMALAGGADLVLELPLPWSMAPAERFAEGGVAILSALGCVSVLSFGSECGDIQQLSSVAAALDTDNHRRLLKKSMQAGLSYAAARQAAIETELGSDMAMLLGSANNTLGIEYIRAIRRLHTNIEPCTVQRIGAQHNAVAAAETASASHLRKLIRANMVAQATRYMPDSAADLLQKALKSGCAPADPSRLHTALLAKLRSMSASEIAALPYLSEGLENRLHREIINAGTVEELLSSINTRRYPAARLRRILWASLLGLPAKPPCPTPPYIRLLGMNERGRQILSAASPTLPIISNARQMKRLFEDAQMIFRMERRAGDLHALTLPTPLPCGTDLTTRLIVK